MPPKPPSEPVKPVRPTPAVGQVWRTLGGLEYVIQKGETSGYVCVHSNGDIDFGFTSLGACVTGDDTYIGQFAGFKIEEDQR